MKNKTYYGLLVMVLTVTLLFPLVSAGTMTRTSSSSSVSPGATFTITYSVPTSGSWGASIVDSVSGGCKFPSGSSSYQSVMLSTDGSTKQITVTAPSSGSCTFTGDYKFGTDAVVSFPSLTVTVSGSNPPPSSCTPNWGCTSWSTCSGNTQSRTCQDTNNCGTTTNKPAESQSCTSTCTPNIQCTSWGTCTNNQQTRTCSDSNNCGYAISTSQYPVTQTCSGDTTNPPSSFDLGFLTKEVFKLGSFSITWWMIIVGAIVILLLVKKIKWKKNTCI